MRIYVASSWRNEHQQEIVRALMIDGYTAYDFRHPEHGNEGFHWSEVDPEWQRWTPGQFRDGLLHSVAEKGFELDFQAMKMSHACVLVLPSGRSSHLEAGWFCGAGRPVFVYIPEPVEPELMYRMATGIYLTIPDLIEGIEQLS